MSLHIDVLTLFPELVTPYTQTSIVGRAAERGLVSFDVHNFRDYAPPPHHHVDDTPYGGGGGMVLKPDPVIACVRELKDYGEESRVIVLAARGRPWRDADAREIADAGGHVVILCGRYKGIDQRIVDVLGADEVSIGDFVVSGGEIGACAVLDSIVRLIPEATGDDSARESDSYGDGLLEYPHYTRPPEFEGRSVPPELLTGDHAKVARWRRDRSLEQTLKVRPDLLLAAWEAGNLDKADLKALEALGWTPPGKSSETP